MKSLPVHTKPTLGKIRLSFVELSDYCNKFAGKEIKLAGSIHVKPVSWRNFQSDSGRPHEIYCCDSLAVFIHTVKDIVCPSVMPSE